MDPFFFLLSLTYMRAWFAYPRAERDYYWEMKLDHQVSSFVPLFLLPSFNLEFTNAGIHVNRSLNPLGYLNQSCFASFLEA